MQFKKLELHGFKSFANRTEIFFEQGITGIVGPNGCGKSNVVDAIRWVLGTLSYKSIRGDEMMDVIFKGAEGVSPKNFAEVSLTLSNDDHILPIEYNEVTITRRLFTSGESEYLINKTFCRLKDIRELLYGTGIGTDNYSIINQGEIDKLILANPYEKRLLLDEAAGISKYRAKKKEAESRLEKVAQDLFRLTDVTREVSREMRSIKIQANRAERYKELQNELRNKKLIFILHNYDELFTKHKHISEQIDSLAKSKNEIESRVEKLGKDIVEHKNRFNQLETTYRDTNKELSVVNSRIVLLEGCISNNTNRLSELKSEKEKYILEKEGLEHRIKKLNCDVEEIKNTKSSFENDLIEYEKKSLEMDLKLKDAIKECDTLSKEIETKKGEVIELVHKEANYKNELNQIIAEKNNAKAKLEKIISNKSRMECDSDSIKEKFSECSFKKQTVEREIDNILSSLTREEKAQKELKKNIDILDKYLMSLREEKEKKISRRDLLIDLEKQLEELDTGAKELLHYNNGSSYPGILGTVADLISVDPQYLHMIESILGEKAGYLVVESPEKIYEISNFIKTNNIGKVAMLPIDLPKNGFSQTPHLPMEHPIESNSNGSFASKYVKANGNYKQLVEYLFGGYLVVENIEAGFNKTKTNSMQPVVTINGDIIYPDGVVVIYGVNGKGSILSRKTELKQLDIEIEAVISEIELRETERREKEKMISISEEKLVMLRQKVYEKNVEKLDVVKELDLLNRRKQFLEKEWDATKIEISDIEHQIASIDERETSINNVLEELSELRDKLAKEISDMINMAGRYDHSKEELKQAITVTKVEIAKTIEKKNAIENKLAMLCKEIDTASNNLSTLDNSILETQEKIRSMESDLENMSREIEELRIKKGELQNHISSLELEREKYITLEKNMESQEKDNIDALRKIDNELQELRINENEHKLNISHLTEQSKSELSIDIVEEYKNYKADSIDWDNLNKEIEEIKSKIESIGTVNLLAIDRLKELEERHKFLTAQEEDLLKSKDKLEDFIRKINKESRERFEKTLEQVRVYFNELFRKLFGGGKADIILEEGKDILEAGIDIIARPPQKELTSISLLSGGEKALTVHALIMALFKANPSPFCVLDESDAALDDKNIDKFIGLISEFTNTTQFIVITHNKKTMSMANILYGITMEQPGVSNKVTVTLSQAQKEFAEKAQKEELVGAK